MHELLSATNGQSIRLQHRYQLNEKKYTYIFVSFHFIFCFFFFFFVLFLFCVCHFFQCSSISAIICLVVNSCDNTCNSSTHIFKRTHALTSAYYIEFIVQCLLLECSARSVFLQDNKMFGTHIFL